MLSFMRRGVCARSEAPLKVLVAFAMLAANLVVPVSYAAGPSPAEGAPTPTMVSQPSSSATLAASLPDGQPHVFTTKLSSSTTVRAALEQKPPIVSDADRQRAEAGLARANRRGPKIPLDSVAGAARRAQTASVTLTEPAAPSATPERAAALPTDVGLFRETLLGPTPLGSLTSTTDEPSVSMVGSTGLYTGNWYAAITTDAGSSFRFVN